MVVTNNKIPREKYFLNTFLQSLSSQLYQKNFFKALDDHVLNTCTLLDSHIFILIRFIVKSYCKIRFNSLAKKYSYEIRGDIVRQN